MYRRKSNPGKVNVAHLMSSVLTKAIFNRRILTINLKTTCIGIVLSQPAITCSKLTTETLEKGMKYV